MKIYSHEFLCLRKRGLLEDEIKDQPVSEQLASVQAARQASVAQRIAIGERAGQRVRKLAYRQQEDMMELMGTQCLALSGFSLHAARHLHREDRKGLSQLVFYMGRPALSIQRLEEAGDGDLIYYLRKEWKDGTTGVKLSPTEIIENLVALIPPPRNPLIRFGGVFAPNYSRREES